MFKLHNIACLVMTPSYGPVWFSVWYHLSLSGSKYPEILVFLYQIIRQYHNLEETVFFTLVQSNPFVLS